MNGRHKGGRRPVEFVRHPDTDQPVDGLRFHKPTKRYYRLDRGRRVYYRPNGLVGLDYLRHVLYLHECWRKGESPDKPFPIPKTLGDIVHDVMTPADQEQTRAAVKDYLEGKPVSKLSSDFPLRDKILIALRAAAEPLEDRYLWARNEILKNPVDFAQKTGISQLAYLHRLDVPTTSLDLQVLIDRYTSKQPAPTEKTIREAKQVWTEFRGLVKVQTVADLLPNHFRNYRETITADAKRNHLSPTYIRKRFQMICTILRYNLTEGEDSENLQRAVALAKMLKLPKQNGVNPQPISREDFTALYNAASLKFKTILLLALNCAYYPCDVVWCRKDSINWDTGTLQDFRTKTGVPRIAVLWKRTLTHIKDYLQAEPHEKDTLFVNGEGNPYNANHLCRNFRRLRKLAGVSDTVLFEHIRDGAQTRAIEAGVNPIEADMLLGHKTGVRDNYLKRRPEMVTNACKSIEEYYFGQQ